MGKMVRNNKPCVYLTRTFYSNPFQLTVEKNEVCVDNVWSNRQQQSAPGTCFICSIRDEKAKSEIRHHTAPKQHQFLANTGTRNLTYKLG